MILDILENGKMDDKLDIRIIVTLSKLLLQSHKGYHSSFLADFGARITSAIKLHLLVATNDVMRNVWKEDMHNMVKGIEGL